MWFGESIESLMRDIRYEFRGMRRNGGSAAVAILIVGLDIGGASKVFIVLNASSRKAYTPTTSSCSMTALRSSGASPPWTERSGS